MKSSKSTILHEVNHVQHRIVQVNADGTNKSGEWKALNEIATLDKYFAITGESVLPQGVFTVSEKAHQVLQT